MDTRYLSKRTRLETRLRADPGQVVHDMVYRDGKTLLEAATDLGRVHGIAFSARTARRWMQEWIRLHQNGHASPTPGAAEASA